MNTPKKIRSKVYITGAGPGDEGLLTLKAKEVLQKADVVLYDNLVNRRLLDFCKPEANKIYVGKLPFACANRQDAIHEKLLEYAVDGNIVVRLKGGDPFVYGRGAEEADYLIKHGIDFEIIPGVTAGIAVPAYAGIPVTHREASTGVLFVTAHQKETADKQIINWPLLAAFDGTIVFYMGVKNLPQVVQNLSAHGKSTDTPIAIIEHGTTPLQRTVTGTLDNIESLAAEKQIGMPALIVVGEVVKYHKPLEWFESKPLTHKHILLTHASNSLKNLYADLVAEGAMVTHVPLIDIEIAEENEALQNEIANLHQYNWLAFTSVAGVHAFFKHLAKAGKDARYLHNCKVATVGKETRTVLKHYGIDSDVTPNIFTGQQMALYLLHQCPQPYELHLLHPTSNKALTGWIEDLRQLGATVTQVTAYENTEPDFDEGELKQLQSKFDAITFASPSAVDAVEKLLAENKLDFDKANVVFSIGPSTTAALKKAGFTNITESFAANGDALAKTIVSNSIEQHLSTLNN
ncbi:uroporphyrinogen-III C-methyltransferase [Pinibacter soli]|uniref:uroporphyrinogen-III C-methyltransferase n=1 Tax=Pinibacter soli TaxID=3044211 RepID=A0ABT6RL89_9BACT|nr:uroporphyrinogen-III C-methyltransferase [Pinibacter soli]MDI3322592.1 uroporphyrinogen-III C-methyltransferase [Pinibacter soli]